MAGSRSEIVWEAWDTNNESSWHLLKSSNDVQWGNPIISSEREWVSNPQSKTPPNARNPIRRK